MASWHERALTEGVERLRVTDAPTDQGMVTPVQGFVPFTDSAAPSVSAHPPNPDQLVAASDLHHPGVRHPGSLTNPTHRNPGGNSLPHRRTPSNISLDTTAGSAPQPHQHVRHSDRVPAVRQIEGDGRVVPVGGHDNPGDALAGVRVGVADGPDGDVGVLSHEQGAEEALRLGGAGDGVSSHTGKITYRRGFVKPRLLDLFCGAGGAAMGYHQAGFEVIGVDNQPQPNYPFEFIQADALEFPLDGFDAIHASPPCQAFTVYRRNGNVGDHPDLIAATRHLLRQTHAPYVIENVPGAPMEHPICICGTMHDPPMEIQRHRLFETNWPLAPPMWPCRHKLNGRDRFPGGRSRSRTGSSTGLVRATVEIGAWDIPLATQQQAMGIDWMTLEELSEAIPPAYTRFIGEQLLAHIRASAVLAASVERPT